MICQKCHSVIQDDDAFCFSCGAPQHKALLDPVSQFVREENAIDFNLEKKVRKAKKKFDYERVQELDRLMAQHRHLLTSYETWRSRKAENISQMDRHLQHALQQYGACLEDAEQNLKKANEYLAQRTRKLGSCVLYRNHIAIQGVSLPLDSIHEIRVETTGNVYTSTNIKHSARPTLTRVVAGGLIAGPIGAVVGGAAQKHKLTSQEKIHDDRKVIVTILSSCGSNSIAFPYSSELKVRKFVDEARTAISDYRSQQLIAKDLVEKAEEHLRQARGATQSIDRIYAALSIEQTSNSDLATIVRQIIYIQKTALEIIHQ